MNKEDFPILQKKVGSKQLVYLNSAATSQKPKHVIQAIKDYYEDYNANIHRGNDFISIKATEGYDKAREKAAEFINAGYEEIIFTRGTTEAINLVMYSYGMKLKKGDEIILTLMEHHSNLVPWQFLQNFGVKLNYVDIKEDGTLDIEQLKSMINKNTKLIAITYVSNVLGTINPIKDICKIAHEAGVKVLVDAAQAVPHMPVDVKKLDVDFLAFSGHKMLAPMGIGVLYGKKELLKEMNPFLYGGDMIKEVNLHETTFADLPAKFEAGTQNIEGAIGLAGAIDYLKAIGMDRIREHEKELTRYCMQELKKIRQIKIYGSNNIEKRAGVISFNLADLHPHDVAEFLGSRGISVRAGHMCCQPLMRRLKIPASVRASFYVYNDKEDVDALISALKEAIQFFRIK